MQKRQLLFIGGISLTAALVIAQTLPSTVPLAAREHQPVGRSSDIRGFSWIFDLNGKKYQATIPRDQVAASAEWTCALPLPLTCAKVEEIARVELRKLLSNDSTWEVMELDLRRLNEESTSKWYYLVKLMPKLRDRGVISDSFYVPISFSGEAGQIQAYGGQR
jgi:hypothetical protein